LQLSDYQIGTRYGSRRGLIEAIWRLPLNCYNGPTHDFTVLTAVNITLEKLLYWTPQYFAVPPRPTQPPTVIEMGNEYQPKCGVALRLGSKGRYGSFHLWINMWVAGKTVWLLVNNCHVWAL